jgi:DNA uptake protein ComE-like DNA-binding protein
MMKKFLMCLFVALTIGLVACERCSSQVGVISLSEVSPVVLHEETGIGLDQAFLIAVYRDRVLGGRYMSLWQLYDVPGLSPEVIEQLRSDAGIVP